MVCPARVGRPSRSWTRTVTGGRAGHVARADLDAASTSVIRAMRISELAALGGVPPRTVRHYRHLGLPSWSSPPPADWSPPPGGTARTGGRLSRHGTAAARAGAPRHGVRRERNGQPGIVHRAPPPWGAGRCGRCCAVLGRATGPATAVPLRDGRGDGRCGTAAMPPKDSAGWSSPVICTRCWPSWPVSPGRMCCRTGTPHPLRGLLRSARSARADRLAAGGAQSAWSGSRTSGCRWPWRRRPMWSWN